MGKRRKNRNKQKKLIEAMNMTLGSRQSLELFFEDPNNTSTATAPEALTKEQERISSGSPSGSNSENESGEEEEAAAPSTPTPPAEETPSERQASPVPNEVQEFIDVSFKLPANSGLLAGASLNVEQMR